MSISNVTPLKLNVLSPLVFLLTVLSAHTFAFNVSVEDVGASTNGSFLGGVWTPTADSILSYDDLGAQLALSDVTITTAGPGTISVASSSVGFNYADVVSRTLTLNAAGAIDINGLSSSSAALFITANSAESSIFVGLAGLVTFGGSVDLGANGNVVVTNGGITTNGGSIDIDSSDGTVLLSESAINSGGGNVDLSASGDVDVTDGGVSSDGGGIDIASEGGNIGIRGSGLASSGGNIDISSSGGSFLVTDGGIRAGGGHVDVNVTDSVEILGGGISAGGGRVDIAGAGLRVRGAGVRDSVSVTAVMTGNIDIAEDGIVATGASGVIDMQTTQSILIDNGQVRGATIILMAGLNFEVGNGAFIDSSSGAGGQLVVDEGVILLRDPTVGGDISLLIGLPAATPVPASPLWMLGLMVGLLSVFGVRALRKA